MEIICYILVAIIMILSLMTMIYVFIKSIINRDELPFISLNLICTLAMLFFIILAFSKMYGY